MLKKGIKKKKKRKEKNKILKENQNSGILFFK